MTEDQEAPSPQLSGFNKDGQPNAFAERMRAREQSQQSAPRAERPPATQVEPPKANAAPTEVPSLSAPETAPQEADTTVKATVLSVDESIVHRFEEARKDAPSHTGIILHALEEHYKELPQLILDRRPKPAEGALFAFRPEPGTVVTERRLPIRIRPLAAELAVIDRLVNECAEATKSEVNRSEMVAAALNAYLPAARKRRRRSAK